MEEQRGLTRDAESRLASLEATAAERWDRSGEAEAQVEALSKELAEAR